MRGKQVTGKKGLGLLICVLVVLPLFLGTAQAEPPAPYLVKDIAFGTAGSAPDSLVAGAGHLFFVADDGAAGHGAEVWRSNGSEAGTALVKDIKSPGTSSPVELTAVGSEVYFRAEDATYGRELWASNGTPEGTRRVKDISPGAGSSYPSGLTAVNGRAFFHADDGTLGHGRELWESDGTAAGTALVKDIYPGASGSNPGHLVEAGGLLYFSAEDPANGDELWRSDGRAAGTYLVKNIRSGATGSYLEDLVNVGGTLYFSADDGATGRELWKSNGTEAGTVLVKDIHAGPGGSNPQALANVNGLLIFSADDGTGKGRELWKSNGTAEGTVMIKDIVPGSGSSTPDLFTPVSTSAFQGFLFAAGSPDGKGNELWRSDGTGAGTSLVKDINTGGDAYPQELVSVGGWVYFSADDGPAGGHGRELWKSNGIEADTVLVADIHDGPGSSNPSDLEAQGGLLFFGADDWTHGIELWALVAYAPDLVMDKTVAPQETAPGQQVTYTLSFSNEGNAAATGVEITDRIPVELTQVQVTSDRTLAGLPGEPYRWGLADLAPGDAGQITITGIVQPAGTKGYTFANSASISTTAAESDTGDNEASASVTINFRPSAQGDVYETDEDKALSVPAPGVLDNDSDPEGSPLAAVVEAPPAVGSLDLKSNGSFSYTPQANYHGAVTFDYRASDGTLNSDPSRVTITVKPVNDPPVAVEDSYRLVEDQFLSMAAPGVLANDRDDDSDPLTAVLVDPPEKGDLVLKPDGSFTYLPKTNSNGVFRFTYRAFDGQVESTRATVTLEVTAQNDPPDAKDDAYSTKEDQVLRLRPPGVLENDQDAEGDDLTAVLDGPPDHGALALMPDGSLHYTPTKDYNGPVSFAYYATDGLADSNRATVTVDVTPVNDTPEARPDNYKTLVNQPRQVAAPGVLANDRDVDGDALAAVLDNRPDKGKLEFYADGSFLYTPKADTEGVFPFKYHVDDGTEQSGQATVTLTVAASNVPPEAEGDEYTTPEDVELVVAAPGLLDNDEDADGDLLSARVDTPPAHGELDLYPDGSFVYMPGADKNGPVQFTYRAYDGLEETDPVQVTLNVTPVNDAPKAVNDAYRGTDQKPLEMAAPGVLANDSDVDGDALQALLEAGPQEGKLTLAPDGSFRYEPVQGNFGVFSFTYRATDGQVNSKPATVRMTIAPSLPLYLPLIRR